MRQSQELFYLAKQMRPRPKVQVQFSADIGLVTTIWGDDSAHSVIENAILEHLLLIENNDMTRAIKRAITRDVSFDQKLKLALLAAHASLLNSKNEQQWQSLAEVTLFSYRQNRLYWATVGNGAWVGFNSQNKATVLSVTRDASFENSQNSTLILDYIGGPEVPNVSSGVMLDCSRWLALQRSSFPVVNLATAPTDQSLYEKLVAEDPATSFWLCEFSS